MKTRILPIPMGSGPSPENFYTKAEVDALIADFITNTVDDLTNYYLKSETLTTAEIQALVGQITSFEVVATLPVSDIKTNVIYLLGPIGSGSDRYEEYIYSNNTWVLIGSTSIDLSNYVTITQLNTALSAYTPTSGLATVATSGDYNDLTNKPTIPDAVSGTNDGTNWTTITIGSTTKAIPQGGGSNVVTLTQAQYDALVTKDPNTQYVISDATEVTLNEADVTVNGTTETVLSPDSNVEIGPIFAPTTAGGGNGYILQSGGSGNAPTWVTLASLMAGLTLWQGTTAQYNAIATKGANTLYIIND